MQKCHSLPFLSCLVSPRFGAGLSHPPRRVKQQREKEKGKGKGKKQNPDNHMPHPNKQKKGILSHYVINPRLTVPSSDVVCVDRRVGGWRQEPAPIQSNCCSCFLFCFLRRFQLSFPESRGRMRGIPPGTRLPLGLAIDAVLAVDDKIPPTDKI